MSKRSVFEEQLRSLSDDINNFSQQYAMPVHSSSRYIVNNNSHNNHSASHSYHQKNGSNAAVHSFAVESNQVHDSNSARVDKDTQRVTRERDEALFKLELAQKEIDGMKKTVQEYGKIRALYDNLKQDHESLRISLESSERIRKQQKELITLLQRSHSVNTDNMSVTSFASIPSSIATPRECMSAASGATAENRSWLSNNFHNQSMHDSISIHSNQFNASSQSHQYKNNNTDGGYEGKKGKSRGKFSSAQQSSSKATGNSSNNASRSRTNTGIAELNYRHSHGVRPASASSVGRKGRAPGLSLSQQQNRLKSKSVTSARPTTAATTVRSASVQKHLTAIANRRRMSGLHSNNNSSSNNTHNNNNNINHSIKYSNSVVNDYATLSSIYSAPMSSKPPKYPVRRSSSHR